MNAFSTACRCGRVRLEISGAPILHCICYCKNCQEGGRRLQALAGADVSTGQRWRHRLRRLSERPRALRGRRRTSGRVPARTRSSDPAHECAMLQHGHVPRFHEGALAFDLPQPPSRRLTTADYAGEYHGAAQRHRSAGGHGQLSRLLRQVHVEIAACVARDGFSQARNRRRALMIPSSCFTRRSPHFRNGDGLPTSRCGEPVLAGVGLGRILATTERIFSLSQCSNSAKVPFPIANAYLPMGSAEKCPKTSRKLSHSFNKSYHFGLTGQFGQRPRQIAWKKSAK